MKTAKRFFALVLVLVMVLALGVGCVNADEIDGALADLQAQIEALQSQNGSMQSEIDALQSKIDELNGKINQLNGQIGTLQDKIDELNAQTGSLQDQIDRLNIELVEKQIEIAALVNKLVGISNYLVGDLIDNSTVADLQQLSNTVAQTLEESKIIILHTNDTHGRHITTDAALGMVSVLALRRIYESQGYKVLLVDNGDAIQGTSLVNISEGATAVEFMNLVGYDLAVPGNHEFDWGYENFMDLVDSADFPYIAANLVYVEGNPYGKTAGSLVVPANKIIEVNGVKIGFFGLATPETATKAHPDKVKGIEFYAGEELYACAQAQVNELKAAGVDVVVAIGHLGTDNSSEPNRSTDVIANVDGIDLFLDGHSHSVWENKEVAQKTATNKTILASTGEYFKNVGVVGFTAGNKPVSHILSNAELNAGLTIINSIVNADVVGYINEINQEIQDLLNVTFATTEIDLNGARPAIRNQETNLGNFSTDAMLWAARQFLGEDKVDAAITNGGGIRETIKAGEITMNHMKTVFPFGNTLAVLTITGEQLWEALEAATHNLDGTDGTSIGAFPQIAGIVFELDVTKDWVQGSQYPNSTYFAPGYEGGIENANRRVTVVSVNGKAFDKSATYTIATNDFTAAGGDTFFVFTQHSYYFDTGVPMEESLVQYTSVVLNNVITAAAYGEATVGNRIIIKK